MFYIPDHLHEPIAKNFIRRLVGETGIESTCRRCHAVIQGNISAQHSQQERQHERECATAGRLFVIGDAHRKDDRRG